MVARSWMRRLAIGLVLGFVPAGWSEAGFTIRDLGAIAPGGTSNALAISEGGQAVGAATNSSSTSVAVMTSGSGPFGTIGVLNGAPSVATGIDGSGDISGALIDPADHLSHGFTVINNTLKEFSPLTVAGHVGGATQANGIAGSEVVGTGSIPGRIINGTYVAISPSVQAAFMGSNPSSMTVIPTLGTGLNNYGNGINASGTVVGTSEISANGPLHAFTMTANGVLTDVSGPRSAGAFTSNTAGNAINNQGDVVGDGVIGNHTHAFFAPSGGGTLVDLGLMGGTSSVAYGVNNLVDPLVVGEVDFGSSPDAFLWGASEGMVDLRSLLPPSDQATWTQLSRANAINDDDQIVGQGIVDGQVHGFLLTPIPGQSVFAPADSSTPEPSSLAMLALGGAIALGVARLRRGRTWGRGAA